MRFAASAFAIGTTEFVIVGLLPGIATDLHVSLPSAGLLVSLYALAITLGTPIFSSLTDVSPVAPYLSLMGVFTVTSLVAASSEYYTLLASRIVIAVSHGVFFGVGTAFAASIVPKESRAGGRHHDRRLDDCNGDRLPIGAWIGQNLIGELHS